MIIEELELKMGGYVMFTLLLIPAIMIFFGLLWRKHSPKTIGLSYGYRTTWSMKSQDTWDFAHKFTAKIWLYLGLILSILSIALIFVFRKYNKNVIDEINVITIIVQVICLCLPVIPTEIALRKRFDINGLKK